MGKIAKQAIQGSAYNYIGAFLGFISAGLLMPKFFSQAEIGLINVLLSLTLIASAFATLGFNSILVRLFPYFRDESGKHKGILSLGFIVLSVGIIIILSLVFIFKEEIISQKSNDADMLRNNFYLLPGLIVFASIFSLLDTFNRMLYDAVSGIIFRELLTRIINLIIITLYIFDYLKFSNFLILYMITYSSPAVMLLFLMIKKKRFRPVVPDFKFIRRIRKNLYSVAFFGFLTVFGGVAVMNIDKYMINMYLGLSATGIYSVTFYFAALILLPSRALRKISSVFIAEAWKKNDLNNLSKVYHKSTVTQLIISVYLFVGIWANIHNIFKLLPEYASGIYVILFVGLANVTEMSSGVSGGLIASSRNYKVYAYLMIFMIFSIIVSNIIFIPALKLTGGALASFISVGLTVLLRFLYLYFKHGFQPYTKTHLFIILTGGGLLLLSYFIPHIPNLYLDILMRGSIITVLFVFIVYKAKFSSDVNAIADKYIAKIKRIQKN